MRAHFRRAVLIAVACVAAGVTDARRASADVVERVVAVVDHRPILVSELQHRVRRELIAKHESVATRSEVRTTLETMIDERVLERAAQKQHVVASPSDVERAIAARCHVLHLAPDELWKRVQSAGYTESEYRHEVRLQLLDESLSATWLAHVVPTDADVHAAYARLRNDARYQSAELEVVMLPLGQSPAAAETRLREIVRRARRGEDWCVVTERTVGVNLCGRTTSSAFDALPDVRAHVEYVLARMKEGDVSEPVRFGAEGFFAFRLLRRAPRSFDELRDIAQDIAQSDALEREHREHIDELRREVSIELRL